MNREPKRPKTALNRTAIFALATLSFTAAPASADALLASNSSGPFNVVPVMDSGVTMISQGQLHSLSIKNGSLYSWGQNQQGQLGNGTNTDSSTPLPIPGMVNGVADISAGGGHSLAIQNGAVLAWGWNNFGQLGNGTSGSGTNRNTPTSVAGLSSGVTVISAGHQHSLVIKDGALYSWGAGGAGQLGNGANANSSTPIPITGMESGVTAISAGGSHSLAIHNGALKAWGSNQFGQLGNGGQWGNNSNRNVPVSVQGMESGVTAIAAGAQTSLAVKDGNVYAWGSAGSTILNTEPWLLLDQNVDFIDVATSRGAANASGLALSSDGSIWTWENLWPDPPTEVLPPQGYKFTRIESGFSFQTLATIAPRTTYGDANLDGTVNFDDLLALAQHYGTTAGATWIDGDFNLDNAVDFSDLLALAQHYGFGPTSNLADTSTHFQRDWALALSIVPEPASLSLMIGVFAAGLRRWRVG